MYVLLPNNLSSSDLKYLMNSPVLSDLAPAPVFEHGLRVVPEDACFEDQLAYNKRSINVTGRKQV